MPDPTPTAPIRDSPQAPRVPVVALIGVLHPARPHGADVGLGLPVEEIGDAWGGCEDAEGTHHVLVCMREGGGPEDLGEAVVDFGEDVEEGEEGLVVIEWEGLPKFMRINANEEKGERTIWGARRYEASLESGTVTA